MPKVSRKGDKNASTPTSVERQKRSCTRCNERKIKCDKANPCGACSKSGDQCIFPPPQRAPRTLDRPPVPELLARLRELDTEVEQLRSTQIVHISDLADELISRIHGGNEQKDTNGDLKIIKPSPSGFFDFNTPAPNWSRVIFFNDYLQPSQIANLWKIFQTHVAPIIALLHKPYISQVFHDASNGTPLEHHKEALLLSVCFASIVSMTPDQCLSEIGQVYTVARQNFEIAVNDALNTAKLITSQNITTLQAAVLYLLCSRLDGDSRRIWAESAILIRAAQSQKLHRDGQKLGLPPFECEIRRRTWWHLCILDMLVSEDQDVPRQIHPNMFDTQVPTNVDDDDLTPDMTEMPIETGNFTNMTLCIVTAHFLVELHWLRDLQDENLTMPLSQKEEILQTLGKNTEQKYLQHINLDCPIQWMTATISRLHLSRAWLFVHLPEKSKNPRSPFNDLLFRTGVEILGFVNLLQTNPKITNWSWLWKTNREWRVMAYLISELCDRPLDADSNHAWEIVTKMYDQWQVDASTVDIEMAKTLARLMQRTVESCIAMMGNTAVDASSCMASNAMGPGIESDSRRDMPPGTDLSTLEGIADLSSGLD